MNKSHFTKSVLLALMVASTASGCSSLHSNARKEADDAYKAGFKRSYDEVQRVTEIPRKKLITRLKGNWIGGKSIPVANEASLPAAFSEQWNFIFPDRVNIATAAERITKITGIPVRVKPDVYMDISKLVAGTAGGGTANSGSASMNEVVQTGNTNFSGVRNFSTDVEINFQGTLSDFLDRIASRATISWEYKNGQIEFYRLVTKHFTLRVSPGDSNFTSTVGKTGTTQGGTTGGNSSTSSANQSSFASDSNIKVTSSYNVWQSVESAIKATLSPVGKVSVNQGTGTITVSDNKDNVDQVEKLLERENLMLTRQVRMKVEVINVKLSKDFQNGVDWAMVYQNLNNLLDPRFTLNLSSPTSLVGTEAGSVGFTINNSGAGTTMDRFAGTSAMLKALSGVGQASLTNTTSAVTTNRQPVPVAITNQVSYVAATTPAATVQGGTGGLPGLTPGVVTTGFILNLLPTVHDNGSILVQFSVDISELTRLKTVTSGSGDNQQSIQTPEVSSMQFLQRASLRPGETLILTGFDRDNSRYDKRTLTEGSESFLSGSISGNKTREVSVIMITPVIEDL